MKEGASIWTSTRRGILASDYNGNNQGINLEAFAPNCATLTLGRGSGADRAREEEEAIYLVIHCWSLMSECSSGGGSFPIVTVIPTAFTLGQAVKSWDSVSLTGKLCLLPRVPSNRVDVKREWWEKNKVIPWFHLSWPSWFNKLFAYECQSLRKLSLNSHCLCSKWHLNVTCTGWGLFAVRQHHCLDSH